MGNQKRDRSAKGKQPRADSRHRRATDLERLPVAGAPQLAVEVALRERVKELNCLYTISRLRELHFHSADRFLQGVVDCLPAGWQFPELASAQIVYGQKRYVTQGFREEHWRMSAPFQVRGGQEGMIEIVYRGDVPTTGGNPFLKEEHALIRALAEHVGSALTHMKAEEDLKQAHKALQQEHQSLQESNMALRAVLARLEEEKHEIRAAILTNIQKIIMPLVFELELEVTGRERSFVTLLRQNLQEIASPFMTEMARDHLELTPAEISVSTMIRNGFSTKEIARLRCISPATVRRHRENIRRKLGLRNRKVNLVTYLSVTSGDLKPGP
jgi:DNA-binding NarL/FixJ family response regulator